MSRYHFGGRYPGTPTWRFLHWSSDWKRVSAGVPQGAVLGPLFSLVYINDVVENIHSEIKHFSDDTSLFSVVESSIRTANV